MALTLLDTDGIGDVAGLSNFVVHRAAGMLMAELDCSIEEALMRLRARAFSEAVPIQELAADVERGVRAFEEDS